MRAPNKKRRPTLLVVIAGLCAALTLCAVVNQAINGTPASQAPSLSTVESATSSTVAPTQVQIFKATPIPSVTFTKVDAGDTGWPNSLDNLESIPVECIMIEGNPAIYFRALNGRYGVNSVARSRAAKESGIIDGDALGVRGKLAEKMIDAGLPLCKS